MNQIVDFINNLNIFGKSMVALLILLLILLVVLIIVYIVKNNKEIDTSNIDLDFFDDLKKETENTQSIYTDSVAEEIKPKEEKPIATKIETPIVSDKTKDLKAITEQMEKDIEKNNIELTEFELEQEEKAIISYEELIKKVKSNESLNLEIEANDLDDRGYNLEDEFTFDTEVLDFGDMLGNEQMIKKEEPKVTVNPYEEVIKNTKVKSILDIDDKLDNNIYNANEFLNALKDLRDSLQ